MSSHSAKKKDSTGASTSQDDSRNSLSGGGLTRIRTGSLERLPSLRPKRDLTLGGVPKKTFSPTIPTSRRVKKDPGTDGTSDSKSKQGEESPRGKRRSSLDKKGGGRGKEQRKKGKKDVVTSASVFSMGPADRPMEGRAGGIIPGTFGAELARRPSSSSKDKDKGSASATNHYHNSVINAEGAADEDEEEGVSGNVEELFAGSLLPPVQLPLDYSTHVKQKTLVAPAKTVTRIKREHVDDSVEQMDTSEPSGDVVVSKHVQFAKPVVKAAAAEVKDQRVTAAELFTPSETEKGKFLFIQLPDCLPISAATGRGAYQPMEVDKSSRASSIMTMASGTSTVTSEGEPEQRHCGFADVPEGLIGKLRVHKSGKVKMTLGEVTLDVAMGTSCGFLQQLVCVRPNPPHSKMTILGQLSHRLVCSPDFETMLQELSHRDREPGLES